MLIFSNALIAFVIICILASYLRITYCLVCYSFVISSVAHDIFVITVVIIINNNLIVANFCVVSTNQRLCGVMIESVVICNLV